MTDADDCWPLRWFVVQNLTFGPPPCIFNARTVATRTTTFGCRPEARHLMLKNFSIPMSAPKPASVTVNKQDFLEKKLRKRHTDVQQQQKKINVTCKYFIQRISSATNPELLKCRNRLKTGNRFSEVSSVQENWNEKWVHRASAEPEGL